jgi:GNAT superfamily N-acetyltransferase
MPVIEVLRTYLELRTPEQLRPARLDDPAVRIERRDAITVGEYRELYRLVGAPWHWTDRNAWSDERLAAHLDRDDIAVWMCAVNGAIAGFFELEIHRDAGEPPTVEIAYFGLAQSFIGKGLGKALLTRAAEEAWALAPSRVWLHTCTLDSPHALPNYQKRGFTPFRKESYVVQLPAPI